MLSQELVNQLSNINSTLNNIQASLDNPSFWQSNIFAAALGFSGGFFLESSFRYWEQRIERLKKVYENLLNQMIFYSPRELVEQAGSTSYGTEISLAQKTIIELRRNIKYWLWPRFSKIRKLFKQYERELSKCPERTVPDIEKYLQKTEVFFKKIEDYIYKKTGENQYTR